MVLWGNSGQMALLTPQNLDFIVYGFKNILDPVSRELKRMEYPFKRQSESFASLIVL